MLKNGKKEKSFCKKSGVYKVLKMILISGFAVFFCNSAVLYM